MNLKQKQITIKRWSTIMRRALADARKLPDKEIVIDVADDESFELLEAQLMTALLTGDVAAMRVGIKKHLLN